MNNPIPPGATGHGLCGSWWSGDRAAHCARCCRTLSSTSAFDRHWREPFATCADPADVGLVPVPKKWGVCWSWPPADIPFGAFAVTSIAGEP